MNSREGFKQVDTEAVQPWDTLDRALDVCIGILIGLILFPAVLSVGRAIAFF